jgi:hypothetical protein
MLESEIPPCSSPGGSTEKPNTPHTMKSNSQTWLEWLKALGSNPRAATGPPPPESSAAATEDAEDAGPTGADGKFSAQLKALLGNGRSPNVEDLTAACHLIRRKHPELAEFLEIIERKLVISKRYRVSDLN